MGVPKFYRWISERYPCLSQVINEYQIPQFDNMYLDMNGIIHPCSHPNDDDAHFRISEEEIFQNIFNYIEVIFRLIKPQKVFFMAVDGVAPRAKMNQQRARRFRAAMDAQQQKEEALAKGEVLPTEEKFDSNCITPGTEFMCKLQEQLKYFVNKKISSDPAWQKVKIVLSGHNVPGEGEHKIMEYIRWSKQQPDYNPHTRHCLYGLDADLMFLGLATHELHFSLLREEVKFGGKAQKRIMSAEEQNFHLLHLSLFREYVDKEFDCLKEALGDEYNLERIIDDYILLGFLVGNDFIPHLPDFHISANTLPQLWKTYKEVRPNLDGYLHENGDLDLKRFGTYLQVLSRFDYEKFEIQYEDLKWMAGKTEERKGKSEKQSETDKLKEKFGAMLLLDSDDEDEYDDDVEESDMLNNEFTVIKRRYYQEKFELKKSEVAAFIPEITFKYVEGLQWILRYYFQGVPSWSWYYCYHYAPYLSDIQGVADYLINLDLAKPFNPFEQLMAVLPPGSSKLLPAALQELYKENSPIKDFYPLTFNTDLNGKKQEWEAVVLISFIDEKRLVKAMEVPLSRMTDDEKARNTHGLCYVGTFDPTCDTPYPSTMPNFPTIQCSKTKMLGLDKHCYRIAPKDLKYTYPKKGADPFTMGFPTTRHLKHTVVFETAGCKIFQHASRDANCILNINPQAEKPVEDYAKLLGEVVYVDYPHLVEAFVCGVYTENTDYVLENNCVVKKPADKNKKDCFKHVKSRECIHIKSRHGLEVGDVTAMVKVKKIRGKLPHADNNGDVTFESHWCSEDTWVPAQLILSDIKTPIPVAEQTQSCKLSKIFPAGARVFIVSNPGYASMGKVSNITDNRVNVTIKLDEEPYFEFIRESLNDDNDEWLYAREISNDLEISAHMLSKITSTLQVELKNKSGNGTSLINIGLSVKFANRSLMAPEYARKLNSGAWQYSQALSDIVLQYKTKFPELFTELQKHLQKDKIKVEEICEKFGPNFDYREYVEKVRVFLKSLPTKNAQLVGVGSEMIATKHITEIASSLKSYQEKNPQKQELDVKVKPKVLFNPEFQNGVLPADPKADFQVCDRVVNVCVSHCVPFGLKGTIIGKRKTQDQKEDEVKYEVMFDEEFIGGRNIGSFSSRVYSMLPFMLINFSYGARSTNTKLSQKNTKPPRIDSKRDTRHIKSPRHDKNPKKILHHKKEDAFKPQQEYEASEPHKPKPLPTENKVKPNPYSRNMSEPPYQDDSEDHLSYHEQQYAMPQHMPTPSHPVHMPRYGGNGMSTPYYQAPMFSPTSPPFYPSSYPGYSPVSPTTSAPYMGYQGFAGGYDMYNSQPGYVPAPQTYPAATRGFNNLYPQQRYPNTYYTPNYQQRGRGRAYHHQTARGRNYSGQSYNSDNQTSRPHGSQSNQVANQQHSNQTNRPYNNQSNQVPNRPHSNQANRPYNNQSNQVPNRPHSNQTIRPRGNQGGNFPEESSSNRGRGQYHNTRGRGGDRPLPEYRGNPVSSNQQQGSNNTGNAVPSKNGGSNSAPKFGKKANAQKEAEYEGSFYHGDFYDNNVVLVNNPVFMVSPMGFDPYLQPQPAARMPAPMPPTYYHPNQGKTSADTIKSMLGISSTKEPFTSFTSDKTKNPNNKTNYPDRNSPKKSTKPREKNKKRSSETLQKPLKNLAKFQPISPALEHSAANSPTPQVPTPIILTPTKVVPDEGNVSTPVTSIATFGSSSGSAFVSVDRGVAVTVTEREATRQSNPFIPTQVISKAALTTPKPDNSDVPLANVSRDPVISMERPGYSTNPVTGPALFETRNTDKSIDPAIISCSRDKSSKLESYGNPVSLPANLDTIAGKSHEYPVDPAIISCTKDNTNKKSYNLTSLDTERSERSIDSAIISCTVETSNPKLERPSEPIMHDTAIDIVAAVPAVITANPISAASESNLATEPAVLSIDPAIISCSKDPTTTTTSHNGLLSSMSLDVAVDALPLMSSKLRTSHKTGTYDNQHYVSDPSPEPTQLSENMSVAMNMLPNVSMPEYQTFSKSQPNILAMFQQASMLNRHNLADPEELMDNSTNRNIADINKPYMPSQQKVSNLELQNAQPELVSVCKLENGHKSENLSSAMNMLQGIPDHIPEHALQNNHVPGSQNTRSEPVARDAQSDTTSITDTLSVTDSKSTASLDSSTDPQKSKGKKKLRINFKNRPKNKK